MTKAAKKFTSTVAGASILLTSVGLISRGFGMIREIVFAGSFGLTSQYDLFLVGTIIPLTLNTIVIYIAQNYFIPIYNRLKSDSPEEAKTFVVKSLIMFLLGGILVMTVLFLLAGTIISLYLDAPVVAETVLAIKVFRVYTFTIPLNAAFGVLAAFLYSEFDFKLPSFSQLIVNISVIAAVLFFSSTFGVLSIAFGYLAGISLQLIFIIIYIMRTKLSSLSFKKTGKRLWYWDSGIILIVFIESLSQVYVLSDRYFLSEVARGGIAALNYSLNLFQLPVAIISAALSTALFPSFSKSFVDDNLNEIKAKLSKFFWLNLYLFILITFIYVFFGDLIIRLLFQRGAFGIKDSYMTYETLKYLSISLVFYSGYAVLNKLLYSMNLGKQLLIITILGCSIKITCNFLFVGSLGQNGLALSSSISYIFFFISSLLLVKTQLRLDLNKIIISKFAFILFNTLFSFGLSRIVLHYLVAWESLVFTQIIGLLLFVIIFVVNSFMLESKKILNIFRVFLPKSNLHKYFASRN